VNTTPYLILSEPLMVQTEVKRSKFLAYASPTQGVSAAKAFIAEIKALNPDASHNCWAFVANRPENSIDIGFSDDGEPSGCAGRPMLNVLQGSGIGEITVVVSRYFGGTKLGTGGMARAYGSAVSAVLSEVATKLKSVMLKAHCTCGYQWTSLIEQMVQQYEAEIVVSEYGEFIDYQLEIDARVIKVFSIELFERSNGQITLQYE